MAALKDPRYARAHAAGYKTGYYHSTKGDFTEFELGHSSRRGSDFGFHVATTPEQANEAILNSGMQNYQERQRDDTSRDPRFREEAARYLEEAYAGANVIELAIKADNTLRLPDFGRWNHPSNAAVALESTEWNQSGKLKEGLDTNDPETAQKILALANTKHITPDEWKAGFKQILKDAGYDSVAYSNTIEGHGEDSLMLLEPEQLKSINAAEFNPDDKNILHNVPVETKAFPGPPPWHWNCRSTLIPILKSFAELDPSDQRVIPMGKRSSMNGLVAGDMTYDEWFKTLPEVQQREVLGDRKWELWKKGNLSMRDMIDQRGNPLTIEQLEAKVGNASFNAPAMLNSQSEPITGTPRVMTGLRDLEGVYWEGKPDEVFDAAKSYLLEATERSKQSAYRQEIEWGYRYDVHGNPVVPAIMGNESMIDINQSYFSDSSRFDVIDYMKSESPTDIVLHTHPVNGQDNMSGYGASLSPGDLFHLFFPDSRRNGEIWAITTAGEEYVATRTKAYDDILAGNHVANWLEDAWDIEFEAFFRTYRNTIERDYDMGPNEHPSGFARALAAHATNELLADVTKAFKYEGTLPEQLYDMYMDIPNDAQQHKQRVAHSFKASVTDKLRKKK